MAGFDAWNVFVCIFEDFKKLKTCWLFKETVIFVLWTGAMSSGTGGTQTRARGPGPRDPGPWTRTQGPGPTDLDPGTRAHGSGPRDPGPQTRTQVILAPLRKSRFLVKYDFHWFWKQQKLNLLLVQWCWRNGVVFHSMLSSGVPFQHNLKNGVLLCTVSTHFEQIPPTYPPSPESTAPRPWGIWVGVFGVCFQNVLKQYYVCSIVFVESVPQRWTYFGKLQHLSETAESAASMIVVPSGFQLFNKAGIDRGAQDANHILNHLLHL